MELKPGYKRTEVGVIPEGWEVVPIGDIAKFTSGSLIDVSALHGRSSEYPVPVFGGNGIAGYTSDALVLVPSVVVGRVGQKCGMVYLSDGPAWITDNALYPKRICRPMDMRFLALALEGARLNEVRNRNDLPLITQAIVHAVRIAWPLDVSEQRAIAAVLSDVDALITALDCLIAKKRAIKQGTMQQLLTGKTRLPGFSGAWTPYCFEEIAAIRKEKVDPKKIGGHSFCVELEHIGQSSGQLIGYSTATEESSVKAHFCSGDVLFGRLRAYLRKYWIADRDGVCSTEIWPLVAKINIAVASYLFRLVQADQFINVASIAYGTHMPRADWNVVKNHTVTLPSLPEQRAIATILSDMDAEIAALEARRDKTRALKQGMMQALLTGRIRLI